MNNTLSVDKNVQYNLIILDIDGHLNLASCLQCGRCSSGCTMRFETDILPHQINRLAMLGMKDKLISSKAIWLCASCQTCVSRCPMKVDTPSLIDKLRMAAKGAPRDVDNIRIFNETFLNSVKRFGRVYELGMMGFYKMKTRDFLSDIAKVPTMLCKGKLAVLPPVVQGHKAVANIFNRVRQSRRAQ